MRQAYTKLRASIQRRSIYLILPVWFVIRRQHGRELRGNAYVYDTKMNSERARVSARPTGAQNTVNAAQVHLRQGGILRQ